MEHISKDSNPILKVIDVNKRREFMLEMFPEANIDKSYVFFYDETNNLKKFHIRESGFNSPFSSNFILGGLVFESEPPNLSDLFIGLNLQKSIKEVKLKHLAKGDFLECLKSQKLDYFLGYLLKNNICIHFHWTNLLQWSIADIVDSAIANSEIAMKVGRPMADKVKSDFYKFAKIEIDNIIDLFYKYQYPNIKKENIVPFIDDLIQLFGDYLYDEEFHFGLESLRQVLKEARNNESLPFLTNLDDHILIKDFSDFYLEPVWVFKNSMHIFDKEDTVLEIFNNTKLMDASREVKNYSFIDSENSHLIQASDVIVGILGKLTGFINTNSYEAIYNQFISMNDQQKTNIDLIIDLIDYSFDKNPGFQVFVDCEEETNKFQLIRDLRDKN